MQKVLSSQPYYENHVKHRITNNFLKNIKIKIIKSIPGLLAGPSSPFGANKTGFNLIVLISAERCLYYVVINNYSKTWIFFVKILLITTPPTPMKIYPHFWLSSSLL